MEKTTDEFIRGMALRRVDLGMSQVDLQRKVFGYTGPEINRHERGHVKRLNLDRARQIAAGLDATIDELLSFGSDYSGDRCECGHSRGHHPGEPTRQRTNGGLGKTTWKRYCRGHKGYDTLTGEKPCRCTGFTFRSYTTW